VEKVPIISAKAQVARLLKKELQISEKDLLEREKSDKADLKDPEQRGTAEDYLITIGNSALYLQWQGTTEIAQGKASGWAKIFRFSRIESYAMAPLGIKSETHAWNLAPELLLLEAYEGAHAHEKLGQPLVEFLSRKRVPSRDELHVAFFAGWVHETALRRSFVPKPPKGALADLAKQGLDSNLSQGLLSAVCDFQLANSGEKENDGVEFTDFRLIPVWWKALQMLRALKGLSTPKPEHPLFETPFAKFPEDAPKFDPTKDRHFLLIAQAEQILNQGRRDKKRRL
jgi:hypothetical protein